jgi:DNA uptake protein ComE-like DNA-binding protein
MLTVNRWKRILIVLQKFNDGQKLYIKSVSKQTTTTTANNEMVYQNISPVLRVEGQTLVNINSATFEELDKLSGIGQVYGQNIIEQRPYSTPEKLLSRKVLPKSTYEKIR